MTKTTTVATAASNILKYDTTEDSLDGSSSQAMGNQSQVLHWHHKTTDLCVRLWTLGCERISHFSVSGSSRS